MSACPRSPATRRRFEALVQGADIAAAERRFGQDVRAHEDWWPA